jgi:hypothetical protein
MKVVAEELDRLQVVLAIVLRVAHPHDHARELAFKYRHAD